MATKGEAIMSRTATGIRERLWRRVGRVTFLVLVSMLFAGPKCTAQALQKGISVELAVTRNAVAMPAADEGAALVVAVTQSGAVYFGIDPITPAALEEKRGLFSRAEETLFVKADARTPYGSVTKVLDAVRKAGATKLCLLTAQHETSEPGQLVPPRGLEVLLGPPLRSDAESTLVQIIDSGRRDGPRLKINNEDVPWANLESRLSQLYQNHR